MSQSSGSKWQYNLGIHDSCVCHKFTRVGLPNSIDLLENAVSEIKMMKGRFLDQASHHAPTVQSREGSKKSRRISYLATTLQVRDLSDLIRSQSKVS